MPDEMCTAPHEPGTLDPDCRCNEYAKVRAHERKKIVASARKWLADHPQEPRS